jgi:hypothetical protein
LRQRLLPFVPVLRIRIQTLIPQFFSKHKIGTGHDYGVIKFGNPEDHVLTVHGFGDDGAACYEIADALNANACKETHGEPCLNPYSCDALN